MKLKTAIAATLFVSCFAGATDPKPATQATIDANNQVKEALPFNDTQDFKDAQRGFIAS